MKMTHETEVLKREDLLPVFDDLCKTVVDGARQGLAAHVMELAVWERVLQIGYRALAMFFALSGNGDQGEAITLPDGRTCQRLEETHDRRYVSIFGEFILERAVYGSREGQKIEFVPLDNRLQLPESAFSYVLQDWDQSFCVEQAFGPSAEVIKRILGLRQSVDSLERMNVDMAKQVLDYREARPAPGPEEEGEILVTSADGKGIVMRRSEEEKAKKQPKKQPKTKSHRRKGEKANQKRMATVGAVYTVDRYLRSAEEVVAALFRDKEPRPSQKRPEPQHKHVWASLPVSGDDDEMISGMNVVYTWLSEEVEGRRRDPCQELVHLADGQESLWEARKEHLPENTVDILDLLHVTPRIWQAAHVFHKEGSDEAEQFVRERLLRILRGESDLVVRGLRVMGSKRVLTGAKKKTLRKVCAYLDANRHRMHYDTYLAKGYPIASGVIEGACRHLVKDRMERAGMHWRPEGAQAMLDVRSIYVEGAWQQYQAYRIESETSRLYPFRELVEGPNYNLAA